MARQTKSESKLSEAADKTAALLQGLQSRLNRDIPREESPEELDRQLQEYFVAESGKAPVAGGIDVLGQIHGRVIDAVADRILASWERGDRSELGALEKQVIDRLAERILDRMSHRS
ncbi:MAG TPA: hypothetical protein VLN48_14655 [Bryobacteraceae bacterium]|nr:hypothetical protein [Bryobacteraceae bacterium]